MSDENRLLKRLRNNTVKYIRDKDGKIIGIEDPAAQFRVTAAGTMQPGPAGRDGTDGVAGNTGSPGKDGKDGAPGRDGIDGQDGVPGIAGTNGTNGKDGKDGINGKDGLPGKDGTNGLDGAPGKDGAKGADSTVPGPRGAEGAAGKDGAQGIQGIPGKDGAAGKDGAVGANAKRIDTYTGKTDTNGLYTVTYATPFPAIPSVQPEPPAMPNQVWVKVNSTLTGFSLRLVQRNTVNLLNIDVLLGATVNVANADARVVVIAA